MKQRSYLSLGIFLVLGVLTMPSASLAVSATSTTQLNSISTLLQQIQAKQDQIDALATSQDALKLQAANEIVAFVSNLSLGLQGDDVKALQALLAANANIYPEGLITGYFGKATERAVRRFQKENGVEQAGRVGPKTRALLNKLLKQHPIVFEDDYDGDDGDDHSDNATSTRHRDDKKKKKDKRPCAIVPLGHMIAPGWLRKHGGEKPIVPPCQKLPKGIEKKSDDDQKPGTTTPDTISPTINDLHADMVSSTTARVSWTTSEKTASRLWYSTTTPISVLTALTLDDHTFKTSHLFDLSSLSTSTTYYFLVKASDKAHNSATSTERSLVTLGI